VLMDYGYDYDAVGNITEKRTEHGPHRYQYDNLDRLTVADYPNGPQNDQINDSFAPNTFPFADDRYSYDLIGNRQTDQAQTAATPWAYNANNELLHAGFAAFDYNAAGSTLTERDPQTEAATRTYRYNTEERMSELIGAADQPIASYYYDPMGRRLWKILQPGAEGHSGGAGPETVYLAYSDEGYAAEFTLPGTPEQAPTAGPSASQYSSVWVYAPTGLWSTDPIATNTPDGWRFLQTDHLGTPLLAITNSGSTSNQRRMAAFGSTREQGESFSSRFSGQIRDMEKQWVHNLSRELDHRTGRYTSSDPIGLRGGLNIFPYVGSNPIRFSDPLGLQLRMPRIVPPPRGPLPARAPRPDNIPPGRPANDPNYYPPTGGHPLPPVPAPTSPSPASPGDSESQPNPGGRPNGNCTHSRKKELANNVTWECKNKDRPSTCNSYLITCDEILIRAEQARQCRDAREQIMNECFFGGNQKHHDEWEKAYDVEKDCLDRYYFECTDALACI